MAKVGAQRAAELTGKSKSTIQRAMKAGKLSYEPDSSGRKLIDVSELERVYGLAKTKEQDNKQDKDTSSILKEAEQMVEMERLRMQVRMLEAQLEAAQDQINDLKAQRDQWQKQASQVLLTSQHSQEQAKTLQLELDRRRKMAAAKKQAMLERRKTEMQNRVKTVQAETQNDNSENSDDKGQISAFWEKLRGRA